MSKYIKSVFRAPKRPEPAWYPKPTSTDSLPRASTHDYTPLSQLLSCPVIAPTATSQLYRLDARTVLKTGSSVRMAEAAALRFVHIHTLVPVPKVYDAYIHPESKQVCIAMEWVDGAPLDTVWDTYHEIQKADLILQLKQHLEDLRRVPGTFIGSVDGSCCGDQFFRAGQDRKMMDGPFDSEEDFHEGLVRAVEARGRNTWTEMVARFIRALPRHRTVLTHNDLAPRNILVRDGKVVAIVGWEFSGFYPEYWEYVKALYRENWQSNWTKDMVVDRVLQPYLVELSMLLHARDLVR